MVKDLILSVLLLLLSLDLDKSLDVVPVVEVFKVLEVDHRVIISVDFFEKSYDLITLQIEAEHLSEVLMEVPQSQISLVVSV